MLCLTAQQPNPVLIAIRIAIAPIAQIILIQIHRILTIQVTTILRIPVMIRAVVMTVLVVVILVAVEISNRSLLLLLLPKCTVKL